MTEEERITLILEDHRFFVDKRRVVEKSRYFESLFSHNFSDSYNLEQIVNYKVTPSVLQDFCDWIEEDPPGLNHNESPQIKVSLQKYLSDNFTSLKQLLELSIIYTVEELSQELSDIIIQHWLIPEHLLEIWRLSRDLSLSALVDISFYACLERFMELPADELNQTSSGDFLQLVGNVNIESSLDHLTFVINERVKRDANDVQLMTSLNKLAGMLDSPEREPTVMPCFFVEALKSEDEQVFSTRSVYAFQNKIPAKFGELLEIWRTCSKGGDIAGIGVIGHRFSIYKIGGEIRLGSCKFNMNIWRYCLISKKWYYVARLRKPRRHMAVALIDDYLILMGGVSRYRLKTSSVEMLNLKTGKWNAAQNVPEQFIDVPPVCIINGVVAVCISDIYMFDPKSKSWLRVKHEYDHSEWSRTKYMTSYHNTLYLGKENGSCVGYDVSWELAETPEPLILSARISRSEHKHFESPCDKLLVTEDSRTVGIVYAFDRITVECGNLDEDNCKLDSRIHNFNLPVVSMVPVNCFNLSDPATVYKQIPTE